MSGKHGARGEGLPIYTKIWDTLCKTGGGGSFQKQVKRYAKTPFAVLDVFFFSYSLSDQQIKKLTRR